MTRRAAVDLVVAGPPKSGTSTLFAHLEAHPGVDAAHAKEPFFFTTERGLDLGEADGPARSGGWERGLAWYDQLFRGPPDAVRLEGSTDYFPSPSAPRLLAEHAPTVRAVVSVREPAARIVSQYWHERRFSDLPDLADLVADDHPRLAYWLRCSRYGQGLGRWLEHVPAEQLLVVGFEHLVRDPQGVADRVLASVGLPPLGDNVELTDDSSNRAGQARSRRLQRVLTVSRARRVAEELPDWLQRPLRSVARRAMQANLERGAYPATDPDVLGALRRRLTDDRVELERLLERHWPSVLDEVRAWPSG